jgi:formylglycine-generating enzyme required for sulfatase activity
MGRAQDDLFAEASEQPRRRVTLSAFAIDVHPVSNRRYRAFVDAGGYREQRYWSPEGWDWRQKARVRAPLSLGSNRLGAPDQPVCGVSWYEAEAFARYAGRRLPTSAEWERAARGEDGRLFPWGDTPHPHKGLCNFAGRVGQPTKQGSYPAGVSPFGCHDMAGNVNNWVQDVYWEGFGAWCVEQGQLADPVLTVALAERLGVPTAERTDRGGGFLTAYSHFEVLSTTRSLAWRPEARDPWHGFRTVRALASPDPQV